MKLRVTTFNVENLFNRYAYLDLPWANRDYESYVQAVGVASIASRDGDLVSYATTEIQRNNTAQAILDSAPDVLAVQEVENLYTLRNFNAEYLDDYFDRMICIDGNDPRGIDVGLMVRHGLRASISGIRTHIDEPVKEQPVIRRSTLGKGYSVRDAIFSRDCLEVDLQVNGKTLTLLINHFKAQDGKASSDKRRRSQAERVLAIAEAAAATGKLPVVMGDLNADPKKGSAATKASLDPLLASEWLKDPYPSDTWTHYYTSGKATSRLDYILPHKDLPVAGVEVLRKGLTTKCKAYKGERYPTIGPTHTEASDHCPTTVVLDL